MRRSKEFRFGYVVQLNGNQQSFAHLIHQTDFHPQKFSFYSQNENGKEYEFKEVVQKPIAPAYQEVLEKTKNLSFKHQGYLIKEEASIFQEKK